MKLKKGDNILVISGKDKGRTGKIIKAMPKELKILVEKINLKKKHVRPKREGEKGQIVEIPAALDVSNVKIICPKCGKATRVGYAVEKSPSADVKAKKNRICKKCKQVI
jgi:large subunit ribosomal protein L24